MHYTSLLAIATDEQEVPYCTQNANMKFPGTSAFILCFTVWGYAQDEDLLQSVETDSTGRSLVTGAFKSSRVINGHSIEFIGKGVLDFRILHRFGRVNQGWRELFGLDVARMRIGFDYGLTNNLTIGIGRSTLQKELDGFIKYRPIPQSSGLRSSPVSIVLIAGATVQTVVRPDSVSVADRTAYFAQAIIGRKFSDQFTLQFSPTILHRNAVPENDEKNVYAVGAGARYKLTRRMAFVIDYFYVLNGLPEEQLFNPLSIGIDIETGGHVFQLHFSNANGMNERAFISETMYEWGKGDVMFGFNLSRVFNVGKKKTADKW